MQKVQMTISGKQALVKSAMAAQKNNDQVLLMDIMGKIIRLNRTIRQNVRFV